MIGLIVAFLIIAVLAAIFGFGGIAGTAIHFAIIVFWIFVALFVLALLVHLVTGGRGWGSTPPVP